MSNPGVIYLASVDSIKLKSFNRFTIEDNIGEAIHIHLDNIRFDLSINDFFKFCLLIEDVLNDMIETEGLKFNVHNFDPAFLHECALFIDKLTYISKEKIKIKKLKCIVYDNKSPSLQSVEDSPAYNYITGKTDSFKNYEQNNEVRDDNLSRLERINNSIKKQNYPFNDQYIILFEENNYIRDGQHRISCLKALGYKEVEVLRLLFTDDSLHKIKFTKKRKIFKNFHFIKRISICFIKLCFKIKRRLKEELKEFFNII